MPKVKKQKKTPAQIRNLRHLREIAFIITKDRRIVVNFDAKAPTSAYFPIFNKVIIAENICPEVVKKYPLLRQKLLDGAVIHESGHRLLTHPLENDYKNFEQRVIFPNLAHAVMNLVEDKRINRFMKSRYRFDYGKRLVFRHEVIRDGIETDVKSLAQKKEIAQAKVVQLIGALGNIGLYQADVTPLLKLFSVDKKKDLNMKRDLNIMLKMLENVQFKRVRRDVIRTCKDIYRILERYTISDLENFCVLLPSEIRGGTLAKNISDAMRKKLEAEGIALQKADEDAKAKGEKEGETQSGASAGIGTGDEIPAPEADYSHYEEIIIRNKPEIERLLRKLKQIMTPQITRADFQKRGRLMRGILAKAYVRSLSREVSRIYHHTSLQYEKQKVAIQILVDFSASMDKNVAEDIITILTEVFGNWLEDKAYSIGVFGENRQKIKTFFETFDKTRARIGGISVNSWGTMLETSLKDTIMMMNGINEDRKKILVVCSDFALGDEAEALKAFEQILRMDTKLIMVKLCNSRRLPTLEANKNVEVIDCRNIQDLPEIFADIYMKTARED